MQQYYLPIALTVLGALAVLVAGRLFAVSHLKISAPHLPRA